VSQVTIKAVDVVLRQSQPFAGQTITRYRGEEWKQDGAWLVVRGVEVAFDGKGDAAWEHGAGEYHTVHVPNDNVAALEVVTYTVEVADEAEETEEIEEAAA
jgi:hypothetical protein